MVTKPNPRPRPARSHVTDPARELAMERFVNEAMGSPRGAPPAKETTSVGFNFKMTPTDHARLKRVAERREISLQKVLNMVVWPAIAEIEKEQ